MVAALILLSTLSTTQVRGSERSDNRAVVHLSGCVITSKRQVQVPAEEAGVLVELKTPDGVEVEEGVSVEQGVMLARIDDSESRLQKLAAEREYDSAKAQAENEASVEAAFATIGVAKAEYDAMLAANKSTRAAVSEFELRRLELTWTRSVKQWEVAKMEQLVAQLTMAVKEAQIQAAELDMSRRQVKSPLDGEIVQLYKKVGEWVAPGDAILRIVGMKRLRVEGFVDAFEFTPAQLAGRPVSIVVHLPTGDVSFEGHVGYVSPTVEDSNEFRIWAEVENQKHNGHWVLRPGLNAEMTIDLSRPAVATTAR